LNKTIRVYYNKHNGRGGCESTNRASDVGQRSSAKMNRWLTLFMHKSLSVTL